MDRVMMPGLECGVRFKKDDAPTRTLLRNHLRSCFLFFFLFLTDPE